MTRDTWQNVGLATLTAVVLAGVVALLAWYPPAPPPFHAAKFQPVAPTATPAEPTLHLPAHDVDAVFFGDSFTVGTGADRPHQGYAYRAADLLGWDATVDGVPGSGYVEPGPSKVTYAQRFASFHAPAPDVFVLQGSINDQWQPTAVPDAASAFVDRVQSRYPSTQVLMVGPLVSNPGDASEVQRTQALDSTLSQVAAQENVPYVSTLSWVDARNAGRFIADDQTHPSTAGHAYMARRLARAIRSLQG